MGGGHRETQSGLSLTADAGYLAVASEVLVPQSLAVSTASPLPDRRKKVTMGSVDTVISIPARFNGPPTAANGGYACGVVAGHAGELGPARRAVTLHAPVPLDSPLDLRASGSRMHLWAGTELIASAGSASGPISPVGPVDAAVAATSAERFAGYIGHPFPTCFVCGTDRAEDEGLLLTPAPVPGRGKTVACLWTPSPAMTDELGLVPAEIVWSVLDCPGGWTGSPAVEPMVLSRMSAEVYASPQIGADYVVVAQQDTRNGRTTSNTSALYDMAGTVIAEASAVWVTVHA
jgi:hypothetical protein